MCPSRALFKIFHKITCYRPHASQCWKQRLLLVKQKTDTVQKKRGTPQIHTFPRIRRAEAQGRGTGEVTRRAVQHGCPSKACVCQLACACELRWGWTVRVWVAGCGDGL